MQTKRKTVLGNLYIRKFLHLEKQLLFHPRVFKKDLCFFVYHCLRQLEAYKILGTINKGMNPGIAALKCREFMLI